AGALGRMFDFFVANWQAVIQLWTGIGQGLGLLVTVTGAIAQLSGASQVLAGVFGFLGQHMREVGVVLGVVIPLWIAYAVAQMAANIAMSLNPIGLVVIALAALAAGIAIVVIHWREISAAITQTGAWHTLTAIIHGVADAFGRVVDFARRAADAISGPAQGGS